MTIQRETPPLGAAGLSGKGASWSEDTPRYHKPPEHQALPSDRAMLTGYSLVLSDVEAHCRRGALELNCCANDLQNLDEDRAIAEFHKALAFIKAAGKLIVELRNGGLS